MTRSAVFGRFSSVLMVSSYSRCAPISLNDSSEATDAVARAVRIVEVSVTIAPWLAVSDAAGAVDFYRKAFGAVELYRLDGDGEGVAVAALDRGCGFLGPTRRRRQPEEPARGIGSDDPLSRRSRLDVRAGGRGGSCRGRVGARRARLANGARDRPVWPRLGGQQRALVGKLDNGPCSYRPCSTGGRSSAGSPSCSWSCMTSFSPLSCRGRRSTSWQRCGISFEGSTGSGDGRATGWTQSPAVSGGWRPTARSPYSPSSSPGDWRSYSGTG